MPTEYDKIQFKKVKKYCEKCGTKLKLNCNRDIIRKRFCSHKCNGKLLIEVNKQRVGNKHHNWKDMGVSYKALHIWVRRHKPKTEICEECNKEKPYDVANISGEYKRDINDYKWTCRRCHVKGDGRLLNLKNQI